jgi:hypothetical protein
MRVDPLTGKRQRRQQGGGSAVAVWWHRGISSVAGAALLPHATAVATKTPASTAMAGAQTTINNQLNVVAATVMEMATMTAKRMTIKT